MYPRLSDLFYDLFGINFPLPIYSFGLMVALSILLGAWLTGREMDRMQREGRMPLIKMKIRTKDARGRERTTTELVPPSHLVSLLTFMSALIGVLGAKVFHILENMDQFLLNPGAMIFSTGGLTFYGGLLIAYVVVLWYVRRRGIPAMAFSDALAPGLMLAYGVGRIGCHLAGDGDWGIASNLAAKPDWLPMFLWAETYPNNILNMTLPASGVYPTPLYEFMACALLFGVLWSLRKHPYLNGWLFSIYLMFNGLERFLIEKIRVNVRFDVMGISHTQAEIISSLLILMGAIGLALTWRKRGGVEMAPIAATGVQPAVAASKA